MRFLSCSKKCLILASKQTSSRIKTKINNKSHPTGYWSHNTRLPTKNHLPEMVNLQHLRHHLKVSLPASSYLREVTISGKQKIRKKVRMMDRNNRGQKQTRNKKGKILSSWNPAHLKERTNQISQKLNFSATIIVLSRLRSREESRTSPRQGCLREDRDLVPIPVLEGHMVTIAYPYRQGSQGNR